MSALREPATWTRGPSTAHQLPRALAAPSPQPAVLGGQQRPGPARRTRFRDHSRPANSSGSKKCCGKLRSGTGPCDSVNCKPAILAVGRAGWASVTAEGAAFSGLAPRGSVERRACATGCRRRPPRARPHAGQVALLAARRGRRKTGRLRRGRGDRQARASLHFRSSCRQFRFLSIPKRVLDLSPGTASRPR